MLDFDITTAYIDECGRGPLWGPVCASAVVWNGPIEPPFPVKTWDSKRVSEKKREKLAEYIKKNAIAWSVGVSTAEEVDEMNILNATMQAFHRALDQLPMKIHHIMVDGNSFKSYVDKDGDLVPHTCVPGGDAMYFQIGMASILAKTHRDAYINQRCDDDDTLDAYYGFRKNKGYGTERHIEGLRIHGPTQEHRRSFKWGSCIRT